MKLVLLPLACIFFANTELSRKTGNTSQEGCLSVSAVEMFKLTWRDTYLFCKL